MRCTLNKTRLRRRWLQTKSCMSWQDYQTMMEKQPTQHLRTLIKVRMSRSVDTFFHDTDCLNRGQMLKTQWWSSICGIIEGKTVRENIIRGLLRERQFEKMLFGMEWENVPIWVCLCVHRKQGFFLSVHVDDIKRQEKSIICLPWGKLNERRWSRWTNIIPWARVLGMHSKWMRIKRRYYGTVQRHVQIMCFCWSTWKITRMRQTSSKNRSIALLHGGQRRKMRKDTANGQTKKAD